MTGNLYKQKVLILDFGSQYTQLIARRVREAQVYCEIHPYNLDMEKLLAFSPKGIILSGGPSSIYDGNAPMPTGVSWILTFPSSAFVTECNS